MCNTLCCVHCYFDMLCYNAICNIFCSWFKGATRIYDLELLEDKHVKNKLTSIPHSRTIDPDAKEIMEKLLWEEYDFYHFVRQRFQSYMKWIQADMPAGLVNETLHVEYFKEERKLKHSKRRQKH